MTQNSLINHDKKGSSCSTYPLPRQDSAEGPAKCVSYKQLQHFPFSIFLGLWLDSRFSSRILWFSWFWMEDCFFCLKQPSHSFSGACNAIRDKPPTYTWHSERVLPSVQEGEGYGRLSTLNRICPKPVTYRYISSQPYLQCLEHCNLSAEYKTHVEFWKNDKKHV